MTTTILDTDDAAMPATDPGDDGLYLGPAVVTAVAAGAVTVTFAGRTHAAQPAFAVAYRPVVGDVLLVMARTAPLRRVYAVGVIAGRGTTALSAVGDLEITAPHGKVRIVGGEGVGIEAPAVTVRSQVLELLTTSLVQRARSAFLAVTDLLHLTAGRRLERIAGSSMEQAETRHILTTKETVINASTVHVA